MRRTRWSSLPNQTSTVIVPLLKTCAMAALACGFFTAALSKLASSLSLSGVSCRWRTALAEHRAKRGREGHLAVAGEVELRRVQLAGALRRGAERLLRGFRLGERRGAGGQGHHRQQDRQNALHRTL